MKKYSSRIVIPLKKHIRRIAMSCGLALFFTIIVTMIDRVALHPEREEAAAGSSVVIYGTGRDSGQDAGMATGSGRPAGSGGTDAAGGSGKGDGPGGSDAVYTAGSREGNGTNQDADLGNRPEPVVEKKKIALTFDDGPDEEYTPMLLDGLAERGVRVSFFVIGAAAKEQPEIMKRIVEEGHLIGNHTYNHVDLKTMTYTAARKEIKKANEVIAKYTGEEPCFLRPPFGSASKKIEKELEMIQVLWTIDTMDWSCQNEESICNTVYREIEENSIILMHDEYPSTVRSALSIIDRLQNEGYEFVTVDEIVMD